MIVQLRRLIVYSINFEESVQSLKMVCVGVAGAGWAGADSVGLAGSSGQVWV